LLLFNGFNKLPSLAALGRTIKTSQEFPWLVFFRHQGLCPRGFLKARKGGRLLKFLMKKLVITFISDDRVSLRRLSVLRAM